MKEFQPTTICILIRDLLVKRVENELPVDKEVLDSIIDSKNLTIEDYRYLEDVIFGFNN